MIFPAISFTTRRRRNRSCGLCRLYELGRSAATRRVDCRALEQSRTVTEAAEKLRLTRQALQYKMMKYHLNG
ncbi:MAG: helix-turn-helix domain-containing protein [Flavonifractor plautii]